MSLPPEPQLVELPYSFNYPQSFYPISTTSAVDISRVIINGPEPSPITYSIRPVLPSGLSFSLTNGKIYGNTSFISISPSTIYTVDASYATAVATTTLTISINFLPVFDYPSTPTLFAINKPIYIQPTYLISNIQGINYTLVETSPLGKLLSDIDLTLNSTTGLISGLPRVTSNTVTYYIRANNSGVIFDTSLNISVQNLPTISYPEKVYSLIQGKQVTILPITFESNLEVTYSISNCELPLGLVFNPSTGEISGLPRILTTFRNYIITITNSIGSSSTDLILTIIKDILAPPVEGDNFSSNTFLTDPVVAMRRKAEILQYRKNSSNLTKQQYFSLLAKGNGPSAKRSWGTQGDAYADPNISGLSLSGNTIVCNSNGIICAPSSSSDVPGPIVPLCYNPSIPVFGYNAPNRKRVDIGFKWPQKSG